MTLTKQDLIDKGLKLIPAEEVDIEYDPNRTEAYDFTVENDYTFSTYDGIFVQDTMAIYHPMSNESQQEVKEKMMNVKTATSSDSVNFEISKEMAVGLYVLTKDYKPKNSPTKITDEDIESIKDAKEAVIYKGVTTTSGKAVFNSCLPNDYEFVDKLVTKKVANKILKDIIENYSQEQANKSASKMKDYGFKFATISSPSMDLDSIQIPPKLKEMKQGLENATTEEAAALLNKMLDMLKEHLKDTGLYDLIESGSAKGWSQPMQILLARGLITDTEGNILEPIKSALSEGLSPEAYFKSSAGARKGIIDRVHNTADTGYLARQFIYLLAPVECEPTVKDCGTKRTLTLRLNSDMIDRLKGRYIVNNKGEIEQFKPENFEDGDVINLRSPVYCKTYKLCRTCYGELITRSKTPYVGISAALALGERSTQLIMQTFHTGGAAKVETRNILKDIVENDPHSGLEMGED